MTDGRSFSTGYILMEVLVTIVILVIGLLGLAGFQTRATVAENEGYQRAQALVVAQDMVDRIYANRLNAGAYVQDDIGASGAIATNCGTFSGAAKDVCEWGNAIVGVSEQVGGVGVGTLLRGRGCITAGAANEYIVTVVWQGLVPTVAPVSLCGQGAYGNEAMRRAVSMRVVISTLNAK
jgi:type IV pilus assembly protein PilV